MAQTVQIYITDIVQIAMPTNNRVLIRNLPPLQAVAEEIAKPAENEMLIKNPHHRHRKFNTRDTYPQQNLDNDLCQVVVARGQLVFVRGQVGQEIEGFASIKDAGPGAQAEQAMRNVKQLLEEVGADLCHICRIQVFITDRAHREPVYRAIGECLKGVYPVSTGLIVSGLARPEWLMEIEVTAVIPHA